MTEQELNGAHIRASFEQMDGKGVTKRMGGHRLGQSRSFMRHLAGPHAAG